MRALIRFLFLLVAGSAAAPMFGTSPSSAQSPLPSFDCSLAATAEENLICSSDELASADRETARLYRQLHAALPEPESMRLVNEQRRWVVDRSRFCGLYPNTSVTEANRTTLTVCLSQAYAERIADFTDRIHRAGEYPPTTATTANPADNEPLPWQRANPAPSAQRTVDTNTSPAVSAPLPWQKNDASAPSAPSRTWVPTTNPVAPAPLPWQKVDPPTMATQTNIAEGPTPVSGTPGPTNGQTPLDEFILQNQTMVYAVGAYVAIAGLISLGIVRGPLIHWYRSQIWLISGQGPVDILMKQVGFRLTFEAFILLLSCVFGSLGGFLFVIFGRRKRA